MDELDERTARVNHRLWSRHEIGRLRAPELRAPELRPPELDVDAEMRREAVNRLNLAANVEGMPDRPRIAALSLAIWLTTTTSPEATEAARVLLGHADEIEGGA